MALFGNDEPIILKEGSSAKAQLAVLESLRGSLPAPAERQLEDDIRALKAGIAGEERILFELRNSHMGMCVIQDLFLEHEGLTAQIDFLVITRQRNFVIECKNLYGNIEIDTQGNFIRTFGGRKREGIYSPMTQNRRHIDLIRAMKRADRNAVMNILLDKDFDDLYRSLIVLANPKTVLDDRNAPDDVRGRIIRADQLVATMKTLNNERGPYRDRVPMSTVQKAAGWFMERDKGASSTDYAARYREMAQVATAVGASFDAPGRIDPPVQQQPPHDGVSFAPTCPKCGAPMVLRTAKRGEYAGRQFYGCSAYPKCRGIVNIEWRG